MERSEGLDDTEESRFFDPEAFNTGDVVFVEVLAEESDGAWVALEDRGFPGVFTGGRSVDAQGADGIQILPDYPLPRGEQYASQLPWLITGTDFWTDMRDGSKLHYRFNVRLVEAKIPSNDLPYCSRNCYVNHSSSNIPD